MTRSTPDESIRWGLVGPGHIAGKFATDLRAVPGAMLAAVCSRDPGRARSFAEKHGVPRWGNDPALLAADPEIDIVYLASPHNAHFETAKMLLEAGKPVLCEKPLTVNAAQARELIALSQARGVLLVEAMWTRFLPLFRRIRALLDDGAIGLPKMVGSSFCIQAPPDPDNRWFNPALAGGGLLDVGIYCLAVTQLALGRAPATVDAVARMAATGVDELLHARLEYDGGPLAAFTCGVASRFDNSLTISGSEGFIRVPDLFIHATKAELCRGDNVETLHEPLRAGGFEFEIEETMRCLRNLDIESPLMPHADTLATMETMDRIRGQIGLRYPGEDG